jgi:hypothetical protein
LKLDVMDGPPQPAAEPQRETPTKGALHKLPSENFGEKELRRARISQQSENELPRRLLDLSSFLANASDAIPVGEVCTPSSSSSCPSSSSLFFNVFYD